MKIPDLNILLHAVNSASLRHAACAAWLESIVADTRESLGLPWIVRLGFLRLSTSSRVFPAPLSVAAACAWMDSLASQPRVRALDPGEGHAAILRHLLLSVGTGGNLVTDAHIASLALEHDAVVATGDRDFQRYPGLRVELVY